MNAMASTANPRISAMLQEVAGLMEKPSPRSIPPHIWRNARSPIAMFLAVFGGILLVFELGTLLATSLASGRLSVVLAISALIPLVICVMGVRSLIAARNVLSSGKLYKGKVVAVRPLAAHINGRFFYSATVEFEGPGGEKKRGKEAIDNWSSEYFLNARDNSEDVDLIYAPNSMNKILFPMRIAIDSRFD